MTESKTKYSEPNYVQKQDKAQVPFWRPTIAERTPAEASAKPFELLLLGEFDGATDQGRHQTHDLLSTYSGIPLREHADHIHRTRDRLWDIRQYPCTGSGGWLKPQMCLSRLYPEILSRAKAGDAVVDIGTFIGHDLRRLVVDGAPSARLCGVDIVNHFDVGFDFFRDRERWQGRFLEADFLTIETNPVLQPLKAKTDIIFIASVLHQWDWAGQVRGAAALTQFTKPGSLVVGLQIGKHDAGEVVMQGLEVPLYVHSPDSFARLWEEVGAATGSRWETRAWFREWEWIGVDSKEMGWMGPGVRLVEFAVRRVG